MPITQYGDLYQYGSFLETLLTYGSDTAASHLTNALWYLNFGDMLPCDLSEAGKTAHATNLGFITRWDKMKPSKDFQLYGRLHIDLCNVNKYLPLGVSLHIKLIKGRSSFYLMNATADTTTKIKFLDAKLFVKRMRPHPDILSAHNTSLKDGGITRYNLTRVERKTFTLSPGSNSLSIDNLVLGSIRKRILFTMIKIPIFSALWRLNLSTSTITFSMDGKQIPSEGLSLGMDQKNTSVNGIHNAV